MLDDTADSEGREEDLEVDRLDQSRSCISSTMGEDPEEGDAFQFGKMLKYLEHFLTSFLSGS